MRSLPAFVLSALNASIASRAILGPHRSGVPSVSLLPNLQLRDLLNNNTNTTAVAVAEDATDSEDEWQLDSDPENDEDNEAPTFVPDTSDNAELTPEQKEAVWCKVKSRGYQLSKAMMMNDQTAATMLAWPYTQSPWDGDLRDDLKKWGYRDDFEGDVDVNEHCAFDKKGLGDAFTDIGVDARSSAQGGPNHCFYITHSDGPTVHRDEDGELPFHDEQYYPVDGKDLRVTLAYARIGINRADGVVYFLHRRSPEDAAFENWGYKASPDELPALRASSDISWGMWNRVAAESQKLNYFMSESIINDETNYIIERILQRDGVGTLPGWPGIDFEFAVKHTDDEERKEMDLLKSEAALALLGSPNGMAAGYFLIQHRRQLGWKHIWKVRVWEDGHGEWATPNLLFYVTDRNPWEGPDPQQQLERQMDDLQIAHAQRRRRKRDSNTAFAVVHTSNDGRNVLREHVITVKL